MDAILFSNGEVLDYTNFLFEREYNLYDLCEICSADTICGICYYKHWLPWENYGSYSDVELENDSCIFVLSPNSVYKLDCNYNLLHEYGNEGDSSAVIGQAISADINNFGEIFVLDAFDNSIKHYSYDGGFLNCWQVGDNPIQIDLFNDILYILDGVENSIKKYDSEGNYLGLISEYISIIEPVALNVYNDDEFWLADMDGKRLQRINSAGEIENSFQSYCFYDISYQFGKIIHVSGEDDDYFLADSENNHLIITFNF